MRYDLSSEYVDAQAEAELLQAIATDRALFWELDLPAAAFHTYGEAYKALADAILDLPTRARTLRAAHRLR